MLKWFLTQVSGSKCSIRVSLWYLWCRHRLKSENISWGRINPWHFIKQAKLLYALHKIWKKKQKKQTVCHNFRTVGTVISVLHNRWNTMQLNRALLLPSCWWVLDLIMQLAGEAGNRARATRVAACKWKIWDYSSTGETFIQKKLGAYCVGSSRAASISLGHSRSPFPKRTISLPPWQACHIKQQMLGAGEISYKTQAGRTNSLHRLINHPQNTNGRLVGMKTGLNGMKCICRLH